MGLNEWSHMDKGVDVELAEYAAAFDVTKDATAAAVLVLATRLRQAPEWLAHELLLFKERYPSAFEPQ